MSGPSTTYLNFIRGPMTTMDDDMPVSALKSWEMRSNLQHLIDMSPQHRVNWTGASAEDGGFIFVSTQDRKYQYSALFPHTWVDRRWPCGIDLQVCGKTASGTLTVEARLVPHIFGASVLDEVHDPYWTTSGNTTSTTSAEIISDIYYPGTTPVKRSGWRTFTVIEGGKARTVSVCMSRLDLTVTRTGGNSTDPSGLTRVSVREFC